MQRRASNTGVIMLCGQKVALGRIYRHQTLTVHVSETTFAVELDDGEIRVVRRPRPPRSVTSKPTGHDRFCPKLSRPHVKYHPIQNRQASPDSRQGLSALPAPAARSDK